MDFPLNAMDLIDGSSSFSSLKMETEHFDNSQKYVSDTDVEAPEKLLDNLQKQGHFNSMKSLVSCVDLGKRPTSIQPSLSDFNSYLEFEIYANSLEQEKHKSRWVCSASLKKIFTPMDRIVSLRFSWNYLIVDPQYQLFIRAVPIYASPDFSKVVVKRCPVHSVLSHPSNLDFNPNNVDHILRIENGDPIYEKDEKSGRLSVKVPVDTYISDLIDATDKDNIFITINYKFVCQTSCASGMDRRPIHIIFTLENADGDVFGRRTWGFKICACPIRDMKREVFDEEVCSPGSAKESNGKKKLIKKHSEQLEAAGPVEKMDECFYQCLDALPENLLYEVKSALAGRYFEHKDHADPKVREMWKKLM